MRLPKIKFAFRESKDKKKAILITGMEQPVFVIINDKLPTPYFFIYKWECDKFIKELKEKFEVRIVEGKEYTKTKEWGNAEIIRVYLTEKKK
ncbi:MAG TPA: hypothetical protein VJ343_00265 [archaeon]|nr:hypothetical protein [archaeon]